MTLVTIDDSSLYATASAIRSKAGVQDLFKPSEMASAILAIPTGGGASLGSKSITANGTYYAQADSLDGYSQVTVNVSGGGGGGNEDAIIARTISNLVNNTVTVVGDYAFRSATSLQSVSMGTVSSIGVSAFESCINLTDANFPTCTVVSSSAFYGCINLAVANFPACALLDLFAFGDCQKLVNVNIPECVSIGTSAFVRCSSMSTLSIPKCEYIGAYAFTRCMNLVSLYITGVSSVPVLSNSNAFNSTPIGGYSASAGQYGSIYVPSSLYADFIVHSKWSWFSDRIVSV